MTATDLPEEPTAADQPDPPYLDQPIEDEAVDPGPESLPTAADGVRVPAPDAVPDPTALVDLDDGDEDPEAETAPGTEPR